MHIGTNDFIEGADAEYVLAQIKKITEMADGIPVYVLTPVLTMPELAMKRWIPADYTSVNSEMRKFVTLLKDENIKYIDMQKFVEEFSEGRHVDSIYVDGIHPTAFVHNAVAEYLNRELKGIMND